MLFVNFEKPHRLRLQGTASVDDNDPLLREYAEAQLVVRAAVSATFRNRPRYGTPLREGSNVPCSSAFDIRNTACAVEAR